VVDSLANLLCLIGRKYCHSLNFLVVGYNLKTKWYSSIKKILARQSHFTPQILPEYGIVYHTYLRVVVVVVGIGIFSLAANENHSHLGGVLE